MSGTALQSDVVFRSIEGGITAPRGFRAAGVACGIKASSKGPSGGLDLSLLVSDTMATAAGVFTTNLAKAAPVLLSRDHLAQSGGLGRAIVINSGCANACTGADGREHAITMAARTAEAVGCDPSAVLVASTGVIGVKLKIANVERGIADAAAQFLGIQLGSAGIGGLQLDGQLVDRFRFGKHKDFEIAAMRCPLLRFVEMAPADQILAVARWQAHAARADQYDAPNPVRA